MKFWLGIVLTLSFTAIAVFGAFAMNHGNGHSGCIASVANGAPCPESDPAGFTAFHLNSFKNFSTAIFASFASVLFFGLFAFVALFLRRVWRMPVFRHQSAVRALWRLENYHSPFRSQFTRWLALH